MERDRGAFAQLEGGPCSFFVTYFAEYYEDVIAMTEGPVGAESQRRCNEEWPLFTYVDGQVHGVTEGAAAQLAGIYARAHYERRVSGDFHISAAQPLADAIKQMKVQGLAEAVPA